MRFSNLARPRGAAALGLAALLFLPDSVLAGDGSAWWNVRVRLETRGRYSLVRDTAEFAGEYVYEAVWTGSLERDGPDYILYHASLETVRWELKERAGPGPDANVLSEKDLAVRPVLRMNYVLSEGGWLRFFFTVEGFPVPRHVSPETFALVMPCSRKEALAAFTAGYDEAVSEGSNDVSLDERELRNGPVERVFRWEWKRYEPSSAPPPAGPLFSAHEATVTLTTSPYR